MIEARLDEVSRLRNDQDEELRIELRKYKFEEMYERIRETLFSSALSDLSAYVTEDIFLPAHELTLYEPFISMFSAPGPNYDEPDMQTMTEFLEKFMLFIPSWPSITMEELAAKSPMIKLPRCFLEHPGININSAAAMFICAGCAEHYTGTRRVRRVLMGWDKVLQHAEECFKMKVVNPFRVSERACEAMIAVIKCYELDPRTVLAGDLKMAGKRLSCFNCDDVVRSGMAMKWSDCVCVSTF